MDFTPEQTRIVEHGDGHALVFAVAGSGKTTTLVGRISHLVTQRGVRPTRILATTFSREARRSLEGKLAAFPECTGVSALTLHALATRIVDRGREMGLTELVIGEDHFSSRLFAAARRALLADLGDDERELAARLRQVTFKDFSTYLGIQKGNLKLPYVPADLPADAAALISAPDSGPDAYARLYALHDELRRREGKLDYDDLIVAAWILMSRSSALRDDIASRWDYVNIDEFQDVNLAQSEMMHLVGAHTRSFMAIGDDDQTVYQWRGAHPRFILGFSKRYGAAQYTLPSNFRCPLGVIALADWVIAENRVRAPKRLRATRGGSGVQLHPPVDGQAARVALQVIGEGRSPEDVVILMRTYAQSAKIEQVFLHEKTPYRLIGAAPFYRRPEVTTLVAYVELALADLDVAGGVPLDAKRRERVQGLWRNVANRPSRYLRAPDVEAIARQAWRGTQTLAGALAAAASQQPEHVQRPLSLLSTWLDFLTEDLGTSPGRDVLLDFVSAIGYREFLIKTAPTEEFGAERAGSIDALAEMAQTRSLGALVTHLAELGEQVKYEETLRLRGADDVPRVTLMTAFRAKGLEWPVVIIPDCVRGVYASKPSADAAASEEERRVFYVALTRAQEELHLITGDDDTTDFLEKVNYTSVVGQHDRLAGLLERAPGTWTAGDTLEAAELLGRYEHEAYVQRWTEPGYRARLLGRFQALRARLTAQPEDDARRGAERTLNLDTYTLHGPLHTQGERDQAGLGDLGALLDGRRAPQPQAPAPGAASPKRVDALGRAVGQAASFQPGEQVRHARFGVGDVLTVGEAGGQLEALIRFESGTKRMALAFTRLERV
ncbi:ATP-dependent helicase [Deinococcus marmoris]|uniref:ATP-dependent helicase n=1 Tax=Deinococcus marmoris TaxID=249408 RepID=UPI000495886D|nr:ATP-dependent helicase [Deinococcus marmoris]